MNLTHGGLFSSMLLQQLVVSLRNLKSCLQLPMLVTSENWEFLPLDSPQWQILPSYCMTIMRFGKFLLICLSYLHILCDFFSHSLILTAVPERYDVFEGYRGIWILNQHFEFLWGSIALRTSQNVRRQCCSFDIMTTAEVNLDVLLAVNILW